MFNMACSGIFDSIWLQAKQHLQESTLVSHNFILRSIHVQFIQQFNLLFIRLVFLHLNHILNQLFDIKLQNVLLKAISANLSIVKQILNIHGHELARRIEHLLTFLQLFDKRFKLFLQLGNCNICRGNKSLNDLVQITLLHIPRLNRIKRAS